MQKYQNEEFYQEAYYSTYSLDGMSYFESPNIKRVLHTLADGLCKHLQFNTHLDAGCAAGYIVERMRANRKRSFGTDFSNYVLENAVEAAKPYLFRRDLRLPIPGQYDLIACIEVVEHIEAEYTDNVIDNLCQASNRYIFFSSNYDMEEPTHINLRHRGEWVGLFKQRGFFPIAFEFDAIPWGFLCEKA